MLWEPQRIWEGQDAYLIGGGASLRSFDFDLLKGRNTLGCNDAFRLGSEIIQHCIFGDASWFHKTRLDLEKYKGTIFTCAPALMPLKNCEMITQITRKPKGLHDGSSVGWNNSTGAAAINLAVNMGAKRIFLLGYDLRIVDGQSHWHDHRNHMTRETIFGRFIKGFEAVSLDIPKYNVQVIHVTDGTSSLPFFMQMPFREFYEVLKPVEKFDEVLA